METLTALVVFGVHGYWNSNRRGGEDDVWMWTPFYMIIIILLHGFYNTDGVGEWLSMLKQRTNRMWMEYQMLKS